uniref:Uncharacterized protein n=1 Tax=Maylandia zebra TaxID=106582 RepID=A0A3P9DQN9_9CICH
HIMSLPSAAWFLCALLHPILKELRAERVTGEDGTEEKMLGFWSLLVLSVLVGCICCVFSWMLTYLDSFQPGMDFPTLLVCSKHFHKGQSAVVTSKSGAEQKLSRYAPLFIVFIVHK